MVGDRRLFQREVGVLLAAPRLDSLKELTHSDYVFVCMTGRTCAPGCCSSGSSLLYGHRFGEHSKGASPARKRGLSNGHGSAQFRVNGVVRNLDPWYAALDVQPGDKLHVPPEQ